MSISTVMADILFQKDIDSCILTFLQTIFMKFDIRLKKKKADVPLDQCVAVFCGATCSVDVGEE